MQVVILAGGLGIRLGPLTDRCPKSLVRVGGKPFLQHQLEWLARHALTRVVLCVGHLGEQIEAFAKDGRRFGVHVTYAAEGRTLAGTAGALREAEGLLEEEFCVLNGDSYLPINPLAPIRGFRARGLPALMVAYHNRGRYDMSNAAVAEGFVTAYSRQPNSQPLEFIDYGLRVFRKDVLALIPASGRCDLDVLYQRLIEQGQLGAYVVRQPFHEIGSPKGLARFECLLQRRVSNQRQDELTTLVPASRS